MRANEESFKFIYYGNDEAKGYFSIENNSKRGFFSIDINDKVKRISQFDKLFINLIKIELDTDGSLKVCKPWMIRPYDSVMFYKMLYDLNVNLDEFGNIRKIYDIECGTCCINEVNLFF